MTVLDGFEVGLHYDKHSACGEPLPVEEIVRYNVENVRVLACVAERLKQPGVKDITAYGGWPTVASRIWLISAAARSAQEVTPSATRSASAELTACTENSSGSKCLPAQARISRCSG